MYKVSILVPIYGVEKYIERCARSLLEQTYNNVEYIFVDDCSIDNSISILKKVLNDYPERMQNVSIVSHDHNKGLSAARNTAIENATGQFVCHVDPDDFMELDAIEQMVHTQVSSGADIVTGLSIMEKKDGNRLIEICDLFSKSDMVLDVIKPTLRHTIWGRLIKKSLYEDYDIFAKEGTNVGEDVQVLPRLFYYSDKLALCYHLIYHYNCENENSYIHQTSDLKRISSRQEQDLDSYMTLRDFFIDKDKKYFAETEIAASSFAQMLMETYVLLKDKNNFNRIRKIYNKLVYHNLKIGIWYYFHYLVGYNYFFCKITNKLYCLLH